MIKQTGSVSASQQPNIIDLTLQNLTVTPDSRYVGFPVLQINGVGFIPPTQNLLIPKDPTDTYYQVEAGDIRRLDNISNKVYGSKKYWYVIAWANTILDPLLEPSTVGLSLRIPNLSRAKTYIEANAVMVSPFPTNF